MVLSTQSLRFPTMCAWPTLFALGLFTSACAGKGSGETPVSAEPTAGEHGEVHVYPSCTDDPMPPGAEQCELDLGEGVNSFWMDSDGVAPDVAGCHFEFTDDACSTQRTEERSIFGEFCLSDGDRLVESNPGAGECHTHKGDLGHPDIVSCSAWCETEGRGGGQCEGDIAVETEQGSCTSARCVCERNESE